MRTFNILHLNAMRLLCILTISSCQPKSRGKVEITYGSSETKVNGKCLKKNPNAGNAIAASGGGQIVNPQPTPTPIPTIPATPTDDNEVRRNQDEAKERSILAEGVGHLLLFKIKDYKPEGADHSVFIPAVRFIDENDETITVNNVNFSYLENVIDTNSIDTKSTSSNSIFSIKINISYQYGNMNCQNENPVILSEAQIELKQKIKAKCTIDSTTN